jgi:pimeloyl-ACP methyl ester carboxylesterase
LKIVVVAHSMGGLVARYALETPGKNPGCVSDLFLVGTPNLGSRLSRLQPLLEMVREIAPRPLHVANALRDGLGEAAEDLQPESRFLLALNARKRAASVRYYSLMGRKSFVTTQQRSAIEAEVVRLANQKVLSPASRQELVDLLNSEELTDGKGDGAVTLASARLAGASGEQAFDLDHLELIDSPGAKRPGQGVAFTWIMTTLNWKRGQP